MLKKHFGTGNITEAVWNDLRSSFISATHSMNVSFSFIESLFSFANYSSWTPRGRDLAQALLIVSCHWNACVTQSKINCLRYDSCGVTVVCLSLTIVMKCVFGLSVYYIHLIPYQWYPRLPGAWWGWEWCAWRGDGDDYISVYCTLYRLQSVWLELRRVLMAVWHMILCVWCNNYNDTAGTAHVGDCSCCVTTGAVLWLCAV